MERGVGDVVYAATTVLSGDVYLRVEQAGDETVVAQIGDVLRHTADYKSTIQSRGEALADRMTGPFLALGAFTYIMFGPQLIFWYTNLLR